MSDRYSNRDRSRPYNEGFDENYYDRDFRSRGRYHPDFEADYNYGRGPRTRGRDFDYEGGYGRMTGGYGSYDRYGSQNRGFDRGYGGSAMGGIGSDYGYEERFGRPGRRSYGGVYYGGGYSQDYGQRGYNHDTNRGMRAPGYSGQRDFSFGTQRGYDRGFDDLGFRSDIGYDYDDTFDYDYDFDTTPTAWSYQEAWLIPGPYTGIGPENYRRSDERIKEDINERLTQHGQINARHIQIEVKNGEVTLNGTVDNRHAKRLTEDVIDSVTGVKDVHNQLRIQQQQQEQQKQPKEQEKAQGQQQRQSSRQRSPQNE